jgi:hypothetical protein
MRRLLTLFAFLSVLLSAVVATSDQQDDATATFAERASKKAPPTWSHGGKKKIKPSPSATAESSPSPTTSPTAESSPSPTTSPTAESSPSPTTSPTAESSASPTTSPTAESSPTPTTSTCANPVFTTSDPNGGWSTGGYYVHNNMWNASGYRVSQTLQACAFDNWYVTATADNSSGDGAVKTYPNVHKDFHNWSTGAEPSLSSFATIKSTFAAISPHVGIYNVAYDIWLNGVPGNREVMIWTENYRQVPAGSRVTSGVSLSGRTWDVYATSGNGYIAFVPSQPMTQGSLDLKAMLDWLVAQGRVPANSTLGQIGYGVEVVSTDGKPATFTFTDFSVSTS